MRLLFAFLADYASAQPTDGKLSVVGGGFDTIFVPGFPAQASMTLVIKIEFTPAECNRTHTIEIFPVDGDGRPFLGTDRLTQPVVPQRNPQDPTLPGTVQLVVNLQGIPIKKAGSYNFSILVDGQEATSVPLRVVQPTVTGPTAGG
jgi:hypothetical protein